MEPETNPPTADNPTLPPERPKPDAPTCIADALETVRVRIVDLDTLADAARSYLEKLPRGDDARERNAVEYLTRIVDRIARDARALVALADLTFADVIADAE